MTEPESPTPLGNRSQTANDDDLFLTEPTSFTNTQDPSQGENGVSSRTSGRHYRTDGDVDLPSQPFFSPNEVRLTQAETKENTPIGQGSEGSPVATMAIDEPDVSEERAQRDEGREQQGTTQMARSIIGHQAAVPAKDHGAGQPQDGDDTAMTDSTQPAKGETRAYAPAPKPPTHLPAKPAQRTAMRRIPKLSPAARAQAQLTPTPPDGFPIRQGLNHKDVYQHVLKADIKDFEAVPGPKAALIPFGPWAHTDLAQLAEKCAILIGQLYPDNPDILIAKPSYVRTDVEPFIFPIIVTGLLPRDNEDLINRRCLVCPELAVMTEPFDWFATDYVASGTGTNRSGKPTEVIEAIVAKDASDTLADNAWVNRFILRNNDALPVALPEDEVVSYVLKGVKAKLMEYGKTTWTHLYVPHPTNSPQELNNWLSTLGRIRYFSRSGTLRLGVPTRCTFCFAKDHPLGQCPYPQLPGWDPPPRPADSASTSEGSQGNGGKDKGSVKQGQWAYSGKGKSKAQGQGPSGQFRK
ncbi:hypothetical protein CVT26_006199 [Gymnopilus dilepis]|uniref:Uncharacterized protein n=1 Tax=Gymnopilus dilepis TaxID=231916 RepID=A0A409Y1B8_9AGAR|nr:hypothetical protein CVT26_006199 [Gymnopilus dilepis]